MKDRGQILLIGGITVLTAILIINIFEVQLSRMTKAAEKITVEEIAVEEVAVEEVMDEEVIVQEVKRQTPVFISSEPSYFDDALFIGDSRTVGLYEYGTLKNADYFANTGMSIYRLWDETLSIEDVGRVTLQELLDVKQYGKIYIMLGINELGYKMEKTIAKNEETIQQIKKQQPEAMIYLCANLHVTKARSDKDELINNKNIDKFNRKLKTLTDDNGIYYIDVNEEFDDENGNLRTECTGDDAHVYAKYYQDWSEWLCKNTVQRGND